MSFKLKLVRYAYRLLGTVAPKLSARRLVALFLTPASKGARSAFDPALNVTAETIQFQGDWLPVFRFNPQDSAERRLLLCHGWRGRGAQFSSFVYPLANAGYEVIAFDGPAHGESASRQTNLAEFSAFIKEVAAHVGGVSGALGHSFGASALVYALHQEFAVQRVVLLAPYRSVAVAFKQFASVLDVPAAQVNNALEYMRESFSEHLDAWDLAALVASSQVEALIIHDAGDRQIPVAQSRGLAAAWPKAQLHETNGIGHQRMLKHSDVVKQACDFLAAGPTTRRNEPEPEQTASSPA